MFSDIKKLGKESLLYGLSTVIARFFNFLLMPFYTHFLFPFQYGIVASVFSGIAFLNVIYAFGMNQGYMRYYENKNALPSAFKFIFYLSLFFSTLLVFFNSQIAIVSGIGIEYSRLIIYAAIILWFDSLTLIPFADLRMRHKVGTFVKIRIFTIIINVILNIVFLNILKDSSYIIDGIFISNIISSFSTVLMTGGYLKSVFLPMDMTLFKEMMKYSIPFIPGGLSSIAIQVIDRPIMLKLTSAESVGIYQANYRLAIFMSLIVTMFDQAWRPFVIERANSKDAPQMFAKVFSYFVFIVFFLWLFMAFFIEDLATLKIGGTYIIDYRYWSGLYIVPIIMAAYVLDGFYINFIAPIIIYKNTWAIMISTISGAVLNIFLNILLIPHYSITGAAWSVFLSYFSMAFIIYYFSKKTLLIQYEFGKIFRLLIVLMAVFITFIFYKNKLISCQLMALKIFLLVFFVFLALLIKYFSREEILLFREKLLKNSHFPC